MRTRKMVVASGLALALFGAVGWLAAGPAGAQTSPGVTHPSQTDDNAGEFAKLDANKDGFVDKKEAVMEPRLLANFAAADSNNDGKIDKNEWASFQKNKPMAKK